MTRSRWRESIKSLGSHIDPEKEEQLRKTKIGIYFSPKQPQSLQYYWRLWNSSVESKRMQYKALLPAKSNPKRGFMWYAQPERVDSMLLIQEREIDNKVARIMKLIKNKNQGKKDGNPAKNSELVELIEDFHKQYQELYALYGNLRDDVREKVQSKDVKEGSSSTSSSDTESYHSLDEASSRSSSRTDLSQRARDDFKLKLETSGSEITDLRNKLTAMIKEKEDLHSEHMATLSKIQESKKIIEGLRTEADRTERTKQKLLNECTQLKEKLVEKEKELFSLSRLHESTVPTQIKVLEREVSSLKLELKKLGTQKTVLEQQIGGRETNSKHLIEENSGLQARILQLERKSLEREDELSSLSKKLEENESKSMSKTEELMANANNLQLEINTLRTQKCDLEEQVVFKSNEATLQVKGVMDQVHVLQQELHSLSSQKSESETCLKKVTKEISDFLTQIENLKEKLEINTIDLEKMIEEKEGLEMQVKDLELEVGSLRLQKTDLEEQMQSKNHEADQMREEKEELNVKISQLEKSLMGRDNELSTLKTKFEALDNDSSTQIKASGAEVNNLQNELRSLHTEKIQLGSRIEREKQESLERLTWIEEQNIELTRKIAEYQTTIKGQDDVIKKLNDEHKQVKAEYLESKLNFQIAEKKIEETAEEFKKKFEDSLRILSRRIRVAEQLHVENKDVYGKTKEKYEQEHMDLKERVASTEIAMKRMKDISLTANDMLTGLDTAALKFEECSGNFLNRISKSSCEVLFAKDWVRRKNNAIKHVQEDLDCLLVQLDTKEVEILGFREKVWKLEHKVRELEKMVKEKEEGMLGLGEEKREAIRQLCVWIDYHRSRGDYLKKTLSEMTDFRSQRTP